MSDKKEDKEQKPKVEKPSEKEEKPSRPHVQTTPDELEKKQYGGTIEKREK